MLHVAYIGGSGNDVVCGITDEGPDGVWVIGSTSSPDLQDVSSSAVQHRFSGVTDVMVANISPNGNLR